MHLKTQGNYYHEQARAMEELHARQPRVGAQVAAHALRALAAVLETARVHRLTRHQHLLFRLGEAIAYAECAASLARRAARAGEGQLNPKSPVRFAPEAVASFARIFAREAASKVASEGLKWIGGAAGAPAVSELEKKLNLPVIHGSQAGLLQDMDYAADVIYGRTTD